MKKVAFSFKKASIFVVFMFLLSCLSITAFASETFSEYLPLPKWTYISLVSGGVEAADSDGKHMVGGEVLLKDFNNKATIEATVQRFNREWFNTSYSWSASGTGLASVIERVYLNTGTYRMRLIIKVYSPSNVLLEETTLYTGETII